MFSVALLWTTRFYVSTPIAIGAPTFRIERTILPEADNTYDLGSASKIWNDFFIENITASGTITFSGLGSSSDCLVTNSSGVVATSTCGILTGSGTSTEIAIWSSASALTSANTLTFDASVLTVGGTATSTITGDGTDSTIGSDLALTTGNIIFGSAGTLNMGDSTFAGSWIYTDANEASMGRGLSPQNSIIINDAGVTILADKTGDNITLDADLDVFIQAAGSVGLQSATSSPSTQGIFFSTDNGVRFGFFDFRDFSANRTFTFPDQSGTLALGTSAINNLAYWAGTNTLTGLASSTPGYVLTATSTAPGFSWEAAAAGGGGGAYNTVDYPLNPAGAATATSTPAGSNKKIGTNYTKHTLDFDGTTSEHAYFDVKLPTFTALDTCIFNFTTFASATTTGSVSVFAISYKNIGNDTAWDITASSTASTTATHDTTLEDYVNGTLSLATTSIASADTLEIDLHRRPTESVDDNTADARYVNGNLYCKYR